MTAVVDKEHVYDIKSYLRNNAEHKHILTDNLEISRVHFVEESLVVLVNDRKLSTAHFIIINLTYKIVTDIISLNVNVYDFVPVSTSEFILMHSLGAKASFTKIIYINKQTRVHDTTTLNTITDDQVANTVCRSAFDGVFFIANKHEIVNAYDEFQKTLRISFEFDILTFSVVGTKLSIITTDLRHVFYDLKRKGLSLFSSDVVNSFEVTPNTFLEVIIRNKEYLLTVVNNKNKNLGYYDITINAEHANEVDYSKDGNFAVADKKTMIIRIYNIDNFFVPMT
jgi:hypothetical protein